MPAAKYAKTRLRRLPGFRTTDSPASETFRKNAKSGRRLCGVNHVPLGAVEGEVDFVLFPLFLDLVPENPEDEHVPVTASVEPGLAEHAFLLEAVATEGVDAEDVVLVHLGLDP